MLSWHRDEPMRSQIEKLIIAMPFCPFVVELDGDLKCKIADPERAFAAVNFLVIEDVNGDVDLIPYGQIRRVQVRQDQGACLLLLVAVLIRRVSECATESTKSISNRRRMLRRE